MGAVHITPGRQPIDAITDHSARGEQTPMLQTRQQRFPSQLLVTWDP